MKKATLTLGAGLILLTGWLLVPGIASAQALKTPIEGIEATCSFLGEPEREWVDEDGILHFRGQRGTCRHAADVRGREEFVTNSDWDFDAGVIFKHGTTSFSGRILGVNVSAAGHFTVECTRPEGGVFTCIEEAVWHLEDGRLLKFSVTHVGADDFPVPYTGILLDPPGLGPERRRRSR